MLDNSKSFGHPFLDKTTIVAPLYQCCMVRQQTYDRLLELSNGTLNRVLRHLMAHDPIASVISEIHFAALDRRLGHIIEMIQNCTAKTLLIKG
ncbi:Glycosaminoglycan xylosylkinase [Lamellibrachia satsuma]|nr:Glycosaminoglycan xylosylkinase [Lamellibrachia satsuma]